MLRMCSKKEKSVLKIFITKNISKLINFIERVFFSVIDKNVVTAI